MEGFSNGAILKWSDSQMERFSNGAILKWSNSQLERFGVATLCHISRSQEQRNMACDVLPEIGSVMDLSVIIISLSFSRSLPENIVIPRSITVIHHGQTDLSCSVQWKVIHFHISTKLMASNSNIEDKPTNYI